ncbi:MULTISPECIES: serine hydrolase [unclassified Microbacterium]|uniref:serine hydrolase domain-containing protein n=1 Tax=unclassified Microbacterium TaxID=2609290 RepID=UPI000EA966DB|nr:MULTISPECIES: serine hydrolase domain-containing protein [unclassified Microbacterium]MBT2486177.1 beta-lactamase family protein [Microbacterium sp. ISL-108]RKN69666.1 class A beta-lactamase-related serine hydrolase [Microbacterium sp. CGR2]
MTAPLLRILEDHVSRGTAPGIIGVSGSREGDLEIVAAGDLSVDAIVRIQSMTKPVLAAATLRLVEQGRLGLDDPVERWLPELADRQVLRTPDANLDETHAARNLITVRNLLTNTSGYGMMTAPCPLQEAMVANRTEAGPEPVALGADGWLAALSELPLAFDPGTGWRYHHSFGILGILLSRLVGGPLQDHLREDLFLPLGMRDTGYSVPVDQAHRLPAAYRHGEGGELMEVEPAAGGFSVAPPPFDVSHSELVSTAADYAAFAGMLANGGRHRGEVVLGPAILAQLRSDQVPAAAKTADSFFPGFWDGTGWGCGVAIHTAGEYAGRYGWSGGLGTDFFVDPDGSFQIILTQVQMGSEIMRLFDDAR